MTSRDDLWPDAHMVLGHLTYRGYEARKIQSAVTGEDIWRVATPNRTLLRGEYHDVDAAVAAINEHRSTSPWVTPDDGQDAFSVEEHSRVEIAAAAVLADYDELTEIIANWDPK